MTLAFSINFMPFSGWSRFTMTWMPARDSLPSHHVSVYWLQLRDLIFNDRCFGLRVVGTLKFHHLRDLLSVGINCFPLFLFFFFISWQSPATTVYQEWLTGASKSAEGNICHTDLQTWRETECRKVLHWIFTGCSRLLYFFSTWTSSCSGASQACTWSPMMHLYDPKRICVWENVSMWRVRCKEWQTWNRLKW